MKLGRRALVSAAALLVFTSGGWAEARGGRGGHAGQGAHARSGAHAGHRPHFAGRAVFIAAPVFAAGYYFSRPYFYDPFYPYYPPVYSPIFTPSPEYIERGEPPAPQVQPQPQSGAYWYYCQGAGAYYPYVTECPGGWQRVPPVPPPG